MLMSMAQEGYGIGDDEYSLAYDGCRNLIWYEAQCSAHPLAQWRAGDVLGCLLDVDNEQAVFSLNGVSLPPCRQLFSRAKSVQALTIECFTEKWKSLAVRHLSRSLLEHVVTDLFVEIDRVAGAASSQRPVSCRSSSASSISAAGRSAIRRPESASRPSTTTPP